jgi:phosphoglucosamine mutase
MALIAKLWKNNGLLTGGGVVATVMSNLGLERFLEGEGLALHRTAVGDRYVLEKMRKDGYNLGGEQSGHIIMSDHTTTGDGLVAALQVLASLIGAARPASELLRLFEPMPQILKNVRVPAAKSATVLDEASVKKSIADAEKALTGRGRLLIRKSGTEPLIRVMAEGDNEAYIEPLVDSIIHSIQQAAG